MAPRLRRRAAWLALCLLGASASGAGAAEPACELKLALLPAPGVFEWRADGQHTGLELAMAKELERRSGCSLPVRSTNAARLWLDLAHGVVDLSSGVSYLPERRAQVDFIVLSSLQPALILSSARAQELAGRADFDAHPALRLGVVRQARRAPEIQAWVDALKAQHRLVESVDDSTSLRAYEAGRSDAVLVFASALVGRPPAWWQTHQLVDWFPGTEFQVGWAVSHHVPEALRQRLRVAAGAALADGTWQRLLRQHQGEQAAQFMRYLAIPAP